MDFFAEWCGPCKMVAPKIEELSNAHPGVIFVKIDVDEASVRPTCHRCASELEEMVFD